jgi:putative flippase GtrA
MSDGAGQKASHRSLLPKFLSVGVVNTLFGYGTIFLCMALGAGPFVSNIVGYAVGLCVSFALSKAWVFRSEGRSLGQAMRFIASFAVAYAVNLAALWVALGIGIWPVLAQVVAGIFYSAVMYGLSRYWVFGPR